MGHARIEEEQNRPERKKRHAGLCEGEEEKGLLGQIWFSVGGLLGLENWT